MTEQGHRGTSGEVATIGRRAIVIGGGIAGLLAGRVLADYYQQVDLLERDCYPAEPEPRPGIPHAQHVHILLHRGREILERLFPGLSSELMAKGASTIQTGQELAVLSYFGWRVSYPGGFSLLSCTRSLLDWCLRRRLAEMRSIRLSDGCRVTGLIGDAAGKRVIGVRYHGSHYAHHEQEMRGDLVVDASGRFSRAPDWLAALGYARPQETKVNSYLGYASRLYAAPAGAFLTHAQRPDWKALLLLGKPPDQTRGGVLLPVEGGRWHVTLIGIGKDYPPTDETAYVDFARSLRSRILFDAIKGAQPLSPIIGYQATTNRWRHYESVPGWPEQLVVLGDAVCALNPIYGQGISVTALQAIRLDQCLQDRVLDNNTGMAKAFQREAAHVIETPWLMATGEDARWPATEGGQPALWTRLMHRYLDAVTALATTDPVIDQRLAEVAHLIKPATALFHPRVALHVVARWLNPRTTIQ